MPAKMNLMGRRFGKLTVVAEAPKCRWITMYENQMRGFEKVFNNYRKTGRWLSNEQILYILQHRDVPAKELAKRFNKCEQTIRNVWNGLTKVH